jgi:hypothetical protein
MPIVGWAGERVASLWALNRSLPQGDHHMRTRLGTTLAGAATALLIVVSAAPAGGQEGPPSLGFSVDRTEGAPGEQIDGQVDVADIAARCTTDLEAFQARFQELASGPFAGLLPEGELFDRFFPEGDFVFESFDQAAYLMTGLAAGGIGSNFDGAAETALPQTFAMTFADIATQEPVGDRGTFDPSTGVGSVAVPDVDPGLWAVAAACVGPVRDINGLEAGIQRSGAFLESIGMPVDITSPEFGAFVRDFLGDEEATDLDFVAAIGPELVESIVEPDALGVQIFCVHDASGRCPADVPPTQPPPGGQPPQAPPANPVQATPRFTG